MTSQLTYFVHSHFKMNYIVSSKHAGDSEYTVPARKKIVRVLLITRVVQFTCTIE